MKLWATGRFFPVNLVKTTPEQWRDTMALNLDAVFHLTQVSCSSTCFQRVLCINEHMHKVYMNAQDLV